MVLNKYWSGLAYYGENIYDLKYWRDLTDPERRQDFIYPETFKTGDILIYINSNDYTTKESGEFSYIYINNTFVGKNYGKDGKIGTDDDRNESIPEYYK